MSPRGMLSKGRSHPLERWGFVVVCVGLAGFFVIVLGPTHQRLSDAAKAFAIGGFI